ncbi:hypothetical protein AL073_03200 [Loktanella sp. 1ANDIMAR09]|nr:hypothetical protein AL073_03200 [Loktanella sp. 1ANDIMAR09]
MSFESDSAFFTQGDLLVSAATFTGVGPRAGAEFNTSTGQAGSFGVFGGASAALLYGERTNEVEGSIFFAGAANNSESSNEAVLNFEAGDRSFVGALVGLEIAF